MQTQRLIQVGLKILLLLAATLGPGSAARAQALAEAQVPPLPYVAMQQQYPLARQVTWRRFQSWYQASYAQGSARRLVRFNLNGDVEATGQDLALSALSAPIQYTLSKYYPTTANGRKIPHARPK
jgi:hypothetical protein